MVSNLSIHPMWVMEEYAMIDLIFLWLIPIIPPISAFMGAKTSIILCEHPDSIMNDKMLNGPSFCHVAKIKQFDHDMDDITEGNQKWHGAIPSFNRRAVVRM